MKTVQTASGTGVTIESIVGDITKYASNPYGIQQTAINVANAIFEGKVVLLDSTNPFVQCLAIGSSETAATMTSCAGYTRMQYPVAATTHNDLYLHMSDSDFTGIYALPSTTTFKVLVPEKNLLNAMVRTSSDGVGTVIIPRNTTFYAAGTPFSIQYPIIIDQLPFGGLQIRLDRTITSPLFDPPYDIIPYTTLNDSNSVSWIEFELSVQQYSIVERIGDVNLTGGYTTTVPITDQFYYCAVYVQDKTTADWVPIQTTYTDGVYDPNTPTALIRVSSGAVNVTIPITYIYSGAVRGRVRIDVYQTKGSLSMELGSYPPSAFSADMIALDPKEKTVYTSAFSMINGVTTYSNDTVTGGRNALTFDELKARVIEGTLGLNRIPISPAQIQSSAIDLGYSLTKGVDTITNRVMWVTRPLPKPDSSYLTNQLTEVTYATTPINTSILTIVGKISEIAGLHGCCTIEGGCVITPRAIISDNNGVSNLLSNTQYQALTSTPVTQLINELNTGKYRSTPFYYMYNATKSKFDISVYDLASPVILRSSLQYQELSMGYGVTVAPGFSIVKTSSGYTLKVITQSNDKYRVLPDYATSCLLSIPTSDGIGKLYKKYDERVRSAGDWVYTFYLGPESDIDIVGDLLLTGLNTTSPKSPSRVSLTTKATIHFTAVGIAGDPIPFGASLIPDMSTVIGRQVLDVEFGKKVENIWSPHRSITSGVEYATYATDQPKVYPADVYAETNIAGTYFTFAQDGSIVYPSLIHRKGEFIKDEFGAIQYQHRAGDVILDELTGLPVPVPMNETVLIRTLEVFAIDAIYNFATDNITPRYLAQVMSSLRTTLFKDIPALKATALECTDLLYYPPITHSTVNALVNGNDVANISTDQSIIVTVYLPSNVYNNSGALSNIRNTTIKTVGNYLTNNSNIVVGSIERTLMDAYSGVVSGVTVSNLGGAVDAKIITLLNESSFISAKKVLVALPDGTIGVCDDTAVVFALHDVNG